jgi:hypothetical protein
VGYAYGNFHYNPAHMIAVTLLLHHALALALHGGWSCRRPTREGRGDEVARPRGHLLPRLIGYSVGPLGIHRLGLFLALNAGFWSAICIVISGTIWFDQWVFWWDWYARSALVGATSREASMAEYQNIFTQVQVQGRARNGHGRGGNDLENRPLRGELLEPRGLVRQRAAGADLPGHLRRDQPGHRDDVVRHRRHVVLVAGGLRPRCSCAISSGWRWNHRGRNTAWASPPLDDGGVA